EPVRPARRRRPAVSGPTSLKKFAEDLRRLPRVVAQKVAERSAPALTALAAATFDAGENAYGQAWAPGKGGKRVTLWRTGSLFKFIRYVAIGTKLRVALGVPYAKYQVGKRPVFPRQDTALPDAYVQTLERTAVQVVKEELGGPAK
ncbi:MAG TPA: hypothetical protein VFU90_11345, partial [Candidatus Tumulicola sp.]|nr:hypothetical protein [Candidatus Tumulicola sp.]